MTLLEFQGWAMILLEGYVCWILTKEFLYDKDKYERMEERKRRKTANAKKDNRKDEVRVQGQTPIGESSKQESVRSLEQDGIHAR